MTRPKTRSDIFEVCNECGKIITHAQPAAVRSKFSPICINCANRKKNIGSKNGMWKGNNVKYSALHIWLRKHKKKVTMCEMCNKKTFLELANISGQYKRDINDYLWLCRSCHRKFDNSINNVHKFYDIPNKQKDDEKENNEKLEFKSGEGQATLEEAIE